MHDIDPEKMLHLTYVYGPVPSRRLGTSLGINPLPVETKVCNFDCPYCECGWTDSDRPAGKMPTVEQLVTELELKLKECQNHGIELAAITFAGNGEPTLHPKFELLIDKTCELRDRYAPNAKVTVLTNATRLKFAPARRGLLKADVRQMKLDAGTEATFRQVDRPYGKLTLGKIVDDICDFEAPVMIQSMFFRGEVDGEVIDNSRPEEVSQWLEHLKRIKPTAVHLYSLDRPTAAKNLHRVSREELENIAAQVRTLGIPAETF
ncbi:MAG: radical SAM protein [Acidobacteria bacterium]|nr:radical SAM protein [Acidobacteriota bacterium]